MVWRLLFGVISICFSLLNLWLYISEADKEVLDEFKGPLETEACAVDDEVMTVRCAPLAVSVELVIGPSGLVDALQDLFGSQAVRNVLRPHDALDANILGGLYSVYYSSY